MTRTLSKKTRYATALIMVVGSLGFYASAQTLGLQQAVQKFETAGYTHVHDVELDDGLWEADVTRPDGSQGEIKLDPATGEIFDPASGRTVMNAPAIIAKLKEAGYANIQELEREGALWEAEAWSQEGTLMELVISGHDGRVLHSKRHR